MSLAILIDMNLSAEWEWVRVFEAEGWSTVHWSNIGNPTAADEEVMNWARNNHHVVFTHDLDFTTALALTRATGPSVIQIRTQSLLADQLHRIVVSAIWSYENELEHGAIIVIDPSRLRVRVLPL